MRARQQIAAVIRTDAETALRTQHDHEAIGRLTDELLPALMAKLAASGLGEIEVRESGWKARLRKPAGTAEIRRPVARIPVESHAGHGHVPVRPASGRGRGADDHDRRPDADADEGAEADQGLVAATSPAVGVYHPRRDLTVGMPVRAGDRIGWVDVLGVQQDVVAPVDGMIGSSLAETGEAVEYGQELVRIELPDPADELEGPRPPRQPSAIGRA